MQPSHAERKKRQAKAHTTNNIECTYIWMEALGMILAMVELFKAILSDPSDPFCSSFSKALSKSKERKATSGAHGADAPIFGFFSFFF